MIKFKKVNGFDELTKVIAAEMEEEKKSRKVSAEMATATTVFVTSIIKTADKYGESRESLMQTTVMGVLQSLFDVDWSTFDPDTGMFKEMK